MTLTIEVAHWLETERHIPVEVAAENGVTEIRGNPAFDYRSNGMLQYRKIRIQGANGEKSFARDRKGVASCAYREQQIQDDPDLSSPLVICEGEIDALSLVAAGVANVISVPDGAQLSEIGKGQIIPAEDTAFGWLWDASGGLKPHFARFGRVVLAVDTDSKGLILREELAVRFERWRCDYVTFPEGCKDANEVLVKRGTKALLECIETAKPLVPNRLVRFGEISDYGSGEVFLSGFEGLDDKLGFNFVIPELVVVTGEPGSGKALALDTPVPTPTGWTTIGAINPGATVYGADGAPCRVVAATGVMIDRPCYRVVMSDGSEVIADEGHLWLTSTDASRKSAYRASARGRGVLPRGTDQRHKRKRPGICTTKDISRTLKRADGGSNHAIELCSPVSGVTAILPIDPYVLGAWLGNGRNRDQGVCLHEAAQAAEYRAAVNGEVTVWGDGVTLCVPGMKAELDRLDVICNKHIPEIYLRADVEQRTALLQGLMDTDGYCSGSRLCEFVSTTKNLADGVLELALGLGLKATMGEGRAMLYGKDCGPKYRVLFTAPEFPVFRLARKRAKQKIGTPNRTGRRYVVSCDPAPSVPVKCIQVGNADGMFLVTRNFIPTHNSEVTAILGANLARIHKMPGAILQFEDRSVRVRETLIRYAKNNAGCHTREEARGWVDTWFRTIEPDQNLNLDMDYTIEWLAETIREARVRHGCRWVVIDPWNEVEHLWDRSKNEAAYTNDALRKMKRLARAHQIILFIVAHPSKEGGRNKEIADMDLYGISGSAAWANKADHGLIVHRPDKSKEDFYLKVAKSKDHSTMGQPGIVRMKYLIASGTYKFVGMGV